MCRNHGTVVYIGIWHEFQLPTAIHQRHHALWVPFIAAFLNSNLIFSSIQQIKPWMAPITVSKPFISISRADLITRSQWWDWKWYIRVRRFHPRRWVLNDQRFLPEIFPPSEPAILQFLHEIEEEAVADDQDSANTQHNPIAGPTSPSRLQRQHPSRQGRIAYVIYGGQGSESGVYYNWYVGMHSIDYLNISLLSSSYRASCMAVIRRYVHNHAPPYQGFNAEEDARASFASFHTSGELPSGLFPSSSLRRLDAPPVPSSQSPPPLTPYFRGMPVTGTSPFSHTTVNPQSPRTVHSPVRAAPQVPSAFTSRSIVRHGPTHQTRANLGSTSNSPRRDPSPLSPMQRNIAPTSAVNPMFYLVVEGHAPGVYGLQ